MIRSMTGYSKVRSEEGEFTLSVGMKSTNHRFLDLQVRLPIGLEPLEPVLRNVVKDHVTRGQKALIIVRNWPFPSRLCGGSVKQ